MKAKIENAKEREEKMDLSKGFTDTKVSMTQMKYELKDIIAKRNKKIVYKCGDYCVKVFDSDYSKSDVLNEALNHARAYDSGFTIPAIEEVTKLGDKWAIVYQFISGPTLDELMAKEPNKENVYLERFVNLQLKMHTFKNPLLNKLKDKMNRKISASGLSASIRYELHMRVDGMPKHDKLCHGDFNPSNIIIGDDGKDYVIDWSHATQGNASHDAARTYLLFKLDKKDDLAEKYLKLFCKKSDTAIQYVQKWMPIVASTQLVKNIPEEREFLLKWTNIMDFE